MQLHKSGKWSTYFPVYLLILLIQSHQTWAEFLSNFQGDENGVSQSEDHVGTGQAASDFMGQPGPNMYQAQNVYQ